MFFNKKSACEDWLSPYYVLGIVAGTRVIPWDIGAVQSCGRTSFVTHWHQGLMVALLLPAE